MDIKEQLSLSNTRMQELLASNNNMQSQIGVLQEMVQTLVQENHHLKGQPLPLPAVNGPTTGSKNVEDSVPMRNKNLNAARHVSMYEPREGPRPLKAPVTASKSVSPSKSSTFMSEEVIRRTNIITKRIQDVFRTVQERRYDQVEPCAERIVEAVQLMATVCQQVCFVLFFLLMIFNYLSDDFVCFRHDW